MAARMEPLSVVFMDQVCGPIRGSLQEIGWTSTKSQSLWFTRFLWTWLVHDCYINQSRTRSWQVWVLPLTGPAKPIIFYHHLRGLISHYVYKPPHPFQITSIIIFILILLSLYFFVTLHRTLILFYRHSFRLTYFLSLTHHNDEAVQYYKRILKKRDIIHG